MTERVYYLCHECQRASSFAQGDTTSEPVCQNCGSDALSQFPDQPTIERGDALSKGGKG